MEARLTTHARHELSRLLTGKLHDVRQHFSKANNDFESTRYAPHTLCNTALSSSDFNIQFVDQTLKPVNGYKNCRGSGRQFLQCFVTVGG